MQLTRVPEYLCDIPDNDVLRSIYKKLVRWINLTGAKSYNNIYIYLQYLEETKKLSEHRIEAGLLTGLAAVAIVVLLYNLFINFLFASLIGSQVWVRISISTLLLGILGIFMGMPFPLGVRITGMRLKK